MITLSQRKQILEAIKGRPKYRLVSGIGIVTADERLQIWSEPEGFNYRNYNRVPSVHGSRLHFKELLKVIQQFG